MFIFPHLKVVTTSLMKNDDLPFSQNSDKLCGYNYDDTNNNFLKSVL